MKLAFTKKYIFMTIILFIIYLFLNLFLSGFYKTIPLILFYAKTVNWLKLSISILIFLATAFLVAINSVYLYAAYKKRRECKSAATAAGAGTIGSFIVGVCPVCVTGLFPIIFGLFGISFSLANLPFGGIEIQILILILLLISLNLLTKKH